MTLTPSTVRLDLKCGRGAISEGEKCTKGAAQRSAKKSNTVKTAAKVALVAGAVLGAGLAGKAAFSKATSIAASRNKTQIRAMSANRQEAWKSVWETNAAANRANFFQRGNAQANYQNARDNLYNSIDNQRRELARMKRFAPKSAARKRAAAQRSPRGRSDNFIPLYAPTQIQPPLRADADGKKYTKSVTNPETGRKNKVRYGAKGYRIAPGTNKGDRYCARSFGDMQSHGKNCAGKDRNTPLCLSRAKWKCSGKSSRRDEGLTPRSL
jgi:hypothetical protein